MSDPRLVGDAVEIVCVYEGRYGPMEERWGASWADLTDAEMLPNAVLGTFLERTTLDVLHQDAQWSIRHDPYDQEHWRAGRMRFRVERDARDGVFVDGERVGDLVSVDMKITDQGKDGGDGQTDAYRRAIRPYDGDREAAATADSA